MAKSDVAQCGGFVHWAADHGRRGPDLTERQGMVLLEFHGTVPAENARQHSLAADKRTEGD